MSSRRILKAAEAVREVVSWAILIELRDPRVQGVTVTRVEMAGDMRQAKVYVSVMGNETQQSLCIRGLQNAAGFLQSKLADRIDTRYTPRIEFVLDQGVKHAIEVARILKEVLPQDDPAVEETAENEAAEDEEIEQEETEQEDTIEETDSPRSHGDTE